MQEKMTMGNILFMGTGKLKNEASLVDQMLTHSMRNWIVYKRKGTSFCRRNSIGGKSGSLTVITGGYCAGFLTLDRRKSFYDSVKNMSIIKFVIVLPFQ